MIPQQPTKPTFEQIEQLAVRQSRTIEVMAQQLGQQSVTLASQQVLIEDLERALQAATAEPDASTDDADSDE